ncbi:MAG: pectate lyase [Phycisphaerales bacterium]|jgi:PelA/Pel-15E family pectate lyase|nr:pectate lyase [Phycisphaerales bacterium]
MKFEKQVSVMLWAMVILSCWSNAALAASWRDYRKKPDKWFASKEGVQITRNILSWQTLRGDWPKNTDTMTKPFTGNRKQLRGTFDNGATTDELRFLAKAYVVTKNAACGKAFIKGLDHILAAQYPTGGWPQSSPPGRGYHRHITFNDNAMVRLMEFLRDLADSDDYKFVKPDRRTKAKLAFTRGLRCILKCQIRVKGKLTAWCAQHDEKNYKPRPARSYEHISISGCESVGIVRLLMSIDKPGTEVIAAVNGAMAWFESAKITGIKQVSRNGDKVIVKDSNAPPLWARFYDIKTNRPIFSGRNGVIKSALAQIEQERRTGYAWYGTWPASLNKPYAEWKKKHPSGPRTTRLFRN